jgi:hypothetical protein
MQGPPSRGRRPARGARSWLHAARLLALALCVAGAPPARAEPPRPLAALRALVDIPLCLTADAAAAAGLIGAAGLGLGGDALSALDANPLTQPLLAGRLHAQVQQLAWSLSQLGTGSFEALRGVDVERWPEPAAAYLTAAPGAGRLDTALGGLQALALAPRDALGGVLLAALHSAGASRLAGRVERAQLEARIARVGPSPAAPARRGAE